MAKPNWLLFDRCRIHLDAISPYIYFGEWISFPWFRWNCGLDHRPSIYAHAPTSNTWMFESKNESENISQYRTLCLASPSTTSGFALQRNSTKPRPTRNETISKSQPQRFFMNFIPRTAARLILFKENKKKKNETKQHTYTVYGRRIRCVSTIQLFLHVCEINWNETECAHWTLHTHTRIAYPLKIVFLPCSEPSSATNWTYA